LLQELPDVVRAGFRYRPSPELEFRVHGDYQRWSVFKNQCVVQAGAECPTDEEGMTSSNQVLQNIIRNWEDAFGVRAGVGYWVDKDVELFGGAGYISNAVPDDMLEPSLPDFNSITVGAGARFGLTDTIKLAASYTQFFWLPRDNTGEGRLDTFDQPNAVPNAEGRYTQSIGAFNANIDFMF
jgi:long-chain fatty acid transport protein